MSDYYIKLPPDGIPTYASASNFPVSAPDGAQAIARDTDTLYVYNQGTLSWVAVATPGAAIALDAIIGDVVATGPGVAPATIQPGVVTNAKLANMPANTIKGNNTGSSATPLDLTVAQVRAFAGTYARSINSVSTNTSAGAAAFTDYFYFVTGTTTITLPTAVGNTNLYNIKMTGTNVVTIATTGGQTIDGSASAAISVQYVSIDLLSDGANWNIV